jgi:hypothetical protein
VNNPHARHNVGIHRTIKEYNNINVMIKTYSRINIKIIHNMQRIKGNSKSIFARIINMGADALTLILRAVTKNRYI